MFFFWKFKLDEEIYFTEQKAFKRIFEQLQKESEKEESEDVCKIDTYYALENYYILFFKGHCFKKYSKRCSEKLI